MKNKRKWLLYIVTAILTTAGTENLQAQDTESLVAKNKNYTGAAADGKMHHVIFQLNSNDTNTIKITFMAINNILKDERFNNKIETELIVFALGSDIFFKDGKYENALRQLIAKGVTVAECKNTLAIRNISKDSLYDFIAYVPSGVGELTLRQSQGWTIIKL